MKVIIAGPRDFKNESFIHMKLDELSKKIEISEVIHGLATGVDTFAGRWANKNNMPVLEFPAEWDKYGKRAGYIRNKQMSEVGDYLIAFYGGSKGTGMMIEIMKKLNKPVTIVDIEDIPKLEKKVRRLAIYSKGD
ncbi:DUF2493 domain-containing protein [Candidatus Gracilibacteria bacterium]|nr:MAG: DUF2493 domain-containing protein [Candidatus Gracilibacteria bacterium]